MTLLPPLQFSVCLETIYRGMPFEQRLEHIKDLGFHAFEFWDRQGKDMNITLALKMALRLEVSAFLGSSISLVDPAQSSAFIAEITKSAALAVDLSCENLIVQSGPEVPGMSRVQQRSMIIENLSAAIETAADAGVTLVLEPLNRYEHPDWFLWSSDEAAEIVAAINSPHVRLCFDIYHQQISEGHVIYNIVQNIHRIGHFHAAGNPGRHELNIGELNYASIFKAIQGTSYNGYVGLEYWPVNDPAAGLQDVVGWF